MKRYGNLWEKVISLENLRIADERARKGKQRSYGVRLHDKNRERNLYALHMALKTKTYHTSQYTSFKVYEPKERVIMRLPYYPDRIVHHAIMNVLEPIWIKTFTYNTYSCITKRGIDACARQTERNIRRFDGKPLYCLKIDIRKFYPSINNEVMKRIVRKTIKDKDLLWLIDEIIDSSDGLPIGNYISQSLANLCLCYFMHYVNEVLPYEVQRILGLSEKPLIFSTQYADDIPFLSDSKEVLRVALGLIKRYIEEDLCLRLKPNYQIFPIADNRYDRHGRALDYVGFKFYRAQKLMRKSIKQRFCRAVAKLNKQVGIGFSDYKQAIAPWLGWAQHSDSKHLLSTILKPSFYGYLFRQATA